jgi:hypothetical protein
MLGKFLIRLRFFMSRKRPVNLDDELQFHLEQSTQASVAAGITAEDARRRQGYPSEVSNAHANGAMSMGSDAC